MHPSTAGGVREGTKTSTKAIIKGEPSIAMEVIPLLPFHSVSFMETLLLQKNNETVPVTAQDKTIKEGVLAR